MTSEPEIVYRLTTPEDRDLILEFIRVHLYPDEPLTLAYKPPEQDVYDEESLLSNVANDPATCIVAMSGDEIVGVLFAGPKGPNEEKRLLEEASHIPGTKWSKLLVFLAAVERESRVFEKYNVEKAWHMFAIGVHTNFRRKRLANKLTEKTEERARELGYPLCTCDSTSVYSARVVERAGYDCVNIFPFADYRAPGSDEQVFFPPEEHQVVKTFAKRL